MRWLRGRVIVENHVVGFIDCSLRSDQLPACDQFKASYEDICNIFEERAAERAER